MQLWLQQEDRSILSKKFSLTQKYKFQRMHSRWQIHGFVGGLNFTVQKNLAGCSSGTFICCEWKWLGFELVVLLLPLLNWTFLVIPDNSQVCYPWEGSSLSSSWMWCLNLGFHIALPNLSRGSGCLSEKQRQRIYKNNLEMRCV
jgi:hypothetical protein